MTSLSMRHVRSRISIDDPDLERRRHEQRSIPSQSRRGNSTRYSDRPKQCARDSAEGGVAAASYIGAGSPKRTGTGPQGSLQQVTWIKPILCALDRLNVRMASGVGCRITLQRFFWK